VTGAHLSTSEDLLRALLPGYLAEWVRLAARRPLPKPEDADAPAPEHHLLYVDAFACSALAGPLATRGQSCARALAAVSALAEAVASEGGPRHPLHLRVVLVEEDPAHVQAIREALEAAGTPVREMRGLESAAPGEVALVEADFADVAEDVARLASSATDALCLLAPPSPRRLPWGLVRTLAESGDAELLVAFPHADLHKQARFGGTPLADLPAYARRIVDGYSALMGDARHEWLGVWREAERTAGPAAAEQRILDRYRDRLRTIGPGRTVRPFALHPPAASEDAAASGDAGASGDAEPAALLHLFQLAPDPARTLAMNGVLRAASVHDSAPDRAGTRAARIPRPAAESEVLELFSADVVAPPAAAPQPVDVAAVADVVAARFAGRTVPFRAILIALADTDLVADEVRGAMAVLKRSGRAVFRSLADDTAAVIFPKVPVPPAAKRRAPKPDDAGLFDDERPPKPAEDIRPSRRKKPKPGGE
jgi:three-Cys-motif partner protein